MATWEKSITQALLAISVDYTFKTWGGHKVWEHESYNVIRCYNIMSINHLLCIHLDFQTLQPPWLSRVHHFSTLPSTVVISLLEDCNSLASLPACIFAYIHHPQPIYSQHNNQSNPLEAVVLKVGSLLGKLLKMQILGFSSPIESETLEVVSRNLCFNQTG